MLGGWRAKAGAFWQRSDGVLVVYWGDELVSSAGCTMH